MGNAASSLPYSIGKQVSTVNDGWALHEGSRNSDGAPVSVFVAKKPALMKSPVNRSQPNMSQYAPALHHFQYCKKLRHPHILQVLATLDTDNPNDATTGAATTTAVPSKGTETGDLMIVTEPCMSFDAWLQTRPPLEQIAWGLEAVVRALHFLHASASLAHGNLSPSTFFVTPAGDVKLWNFSLVTTIEGGTLGRHFTEWEGLVTPDTYRSPERKEGRWEAIAAAGIHAMDSYGVGVLIGHFFGGHIPQPLVKAVQRLQTANLKMRPRLQPLLKCPVFDTPYQKLQLQLEEFTVQPVEQKISFWQNLTPQMQAGLIPEKLAVHKLLPLMKIDITTICQSDSMRSQDMFRRQVLATLQPLFFISEHYLGDKFAKEVGSLIGLLFTVNDRAIRGALVQKSPLLAQHLDSNTLNQSVFEPMCSGFSDSSAALREVTLKATLCLVPSLTQPNLEKLSRYLVRLQSDQEPTIRTNTVIFFGKLAPHLTEMSRQKLLLPAFVRALKDPFPPCRLASLKTTLKAKEFFDPKSIAERVMPVITPLLLDAVPEVRREAFTAIDDLLFLLRQESERMPAVVAQEQSPPVAHQPTVQQPRAAAPPPSKAAAPSSGSYFSSWMSGSSKPTEVAPVPAPPAVPLSVRPQAPVPVAPAVGMTAAMDNLVVSDNSFGNDDDDDGWGDDDLDVSEGKKHSHVPPSAANTLFSPPQHADEDDFFGSFDTKPAKPVSLRKPGGAGGKLQVPNTRVTSKVPAPAVTKLSTDEDAEDGWDDF